MILVAHPFGNANVRAVLEALQRNSLLAKYITTVGWPNESLLSGVFARRGYELPRGRIQGHPVREIVRLLSASLGLRSVIRHERGWASIDRVWQSLDEKAASYLCSHKVQDEITAAYAYEDCALQIFEAANDLKVRRVYDLPIAYWETAQSLLQEEARRYPDWELTLGATRDSAEKLARKTRELELAELVVCPSNFVLDSLPAKYRAAKRAVVVPFGSPPTLPNETKTSDRLRILFAGAMTQRKGLADLFAAMKLVDSDKVELVVMGSLLQSLGWYREKFSHFTYEAPRPHADVLRLMQRCDVFVLPSIVEGRALVQQEAMACALPVIATRNAGADDLIRDGETGFVIPIRSPEAIAEKITWCAAHREQLALMGMAAQKNVSALTWGGYGEQIVSAIRLLDSLG